MNETENLVKFIAELAMEVNQSHIDWGMLAIDEKQAYELMATSAVENEGLKDPMVARAVVTALLVENFVLNLKLFQSRVQSNT